MYQIQIHQFEPRTEEERKKIEEARKYGRDYPFSGGGYPNEISRDEYKTVRVLDMTLTEAEFQAVKKAVLAVM